MTAVAEFDVKVEVEKDEPMKGAELMYGTDAAPSVKDEVELIIAALGVSVTVVKRMDVTTTVAIGACFDHVDGSMVFTKVVVSTGCIVVVTSCVV